jgi:excinuclease ABC subunit C
MYKDLPSKPGCYLYKNSEDKIIYVGKAKNIKKRVSQYFNRNDLDIKTQQLVKNIDSVEFFTTDNETEALLLESTLIKKHRPKYNIDLKYSQRYAYIQITDEIYPRIITARYKSKNGKFFGPFVRGFERRYILEAINKIFKLRTCRKLPKKACLKFHINLCSAPCIDNISKDEYIDSIKKAEQVLKGKTNDLIKQLNEQMLVYSSNNNFEKALELRNQIYALQNLSDRQNVERDKKYDEDIINFIIKDHKIYLMLFKIYKGTLTNKEEFVFDQVEGWFEDFILQYYDSNAIPKELILPVKVEESLINYLQKKKMSKVNITVPKIGEKKHLLELVKKNIELTFFGNIDKVKHLKKSLNLKFDPVVIECFDISHLGSTGTVGSMVQFSNGLPYKTNYRRFKIMSYHGNDDFAGIYEVVKRRYKRLKNENQDFPDLIVIDGGKGQLSSALKALRELEVNIPIISIAKRIEEIFVPGLPESIKLNSKDKGLLYIRQLRDEAHRFAINYNKLLRKKEIRNDKV